MVSGMTTVTGSAAALDVLIFAPPNHRLLRCVAADPIDGAGESFPSFLVGPAASEGSTGRRPVSVSVSVSASVASPVVVAAGSLLTLSAVTEDRVRRLELPPPPHHPPTQSPIPDFSFAASFASAPRTLLSLLELFMLVALLLIVPFLSKMVEVDGDDGDIISESSSGGVRIGGSGMAGVDGAVVDLEKNRLARFFVGILSPVRSGLRVSPIACCIEAKRSLLFLQNILGVNHRPEDAKC